MKICIIVQALKIALSDEMRRRLRDEFEVGKSRNFSFKCKWMTMKCQFKYKHSEVEVKVLKKFKLQLKFKHWKVYKKMYKKAQRAKNLSYKAFHKVYKVSPNSTTHNCAIVSPLATKK